jgi:hypothetical protein
MQHDTEPQEPQNHQVIVEKMRNHGMVPLRDGVIGPFYRGFWGETIIRSGEVHDPHFTFS